MTGKQSKIGDPVIFIAQVLSLGVMWLFVIGIALWIANLISLSLEWNDSIGATLGISLIAIPVFATLASVLTYVFVGLQKEAWRLRASSGEE